ncbi:MAG: hypothetical protein R2690_18490 [Acidimicrobiales bacterium]
MDDNGTFGALDTMSRNRSSSCSASPPDMAQAPASGHVVVELVVEDLEVGHG